MEFPRAARLFAQLVGLSEQHRDYTELHLEARAKRLPVKAGRREHRLTRLSIYRSGRSHGAFDLERLLLPRGKDLSLQAGNLLTWEDISRYNMIFLGPPKYNLQTLDLPVQQDFEIGHARVQNLRPTISEPNSYEERWAPDRSRLEEGHALISRLPGLHRTGEMLILAGSSTECTRAAVEYVTRTEYATPFVRWMREKQGGIPAWYQVVIRARFKSQTPIAIELVAFHPLK